MTLPGRGIQFGYVRVAPSWRMQMDKSDKKELKKLGKKGFIALEKKDIAEAKKAPKKKEKK